jgi:hypothetical protein
MLEDIYMTYTLFALVFLGAARLFMRRVPLARARMRGIDVPR